MQHCARWRNLEDWPTSGAAGIVAPVEILLIGLAAIAAATPAGAGLPPAVAPSALTAPSPDPMLPQFRIEQKKKSGSE